MGRGPGAAAPGAVVIRRGKGGEFEEMFRNGT